MPQPCSAASAHAGVFYRFNVVGETATAPFNFTSFGNGPSINDKGKVAYVGKVAVNSNESVVVWSPVASTSTDIWPSSHLQNRTFGESVRINANDEVAVWTHTFAPQNTYEVRVFRSATANDNSIMVRGNSPSPPYDLLYQNPWINSTKSLEDTSSFIAGGNKDGVCNPGETCVSQTAYNAFRSTPARYLGTVVKNPSDAADPGIQHETGLDTRQSRPMMTDDGRIVVRGNLSSNPILLYSYALGSPTTIAGSAQGFATLGLAPGITPDGNVVAFAGNRGHGDGIFLSIEIAPGTRRLVRIVGENATVQKAELGVDGNNQKLYFQSIDVDSRVGVVYTPDALGTPNKSVVVSFIGTPNAANRLNPATGKPWLFSGQKGLWTIRIDLEAPLYKKICVVRAPGVTGIPFVTSGDDLIVALPGKPPYVDPGANGICESDNGHDTETLFSRSSPIPVVQIGDTIHSTANHVVSAISVHDPLGQANYDATPAARAARNGDHRVAFWASVDGGANQMIVAGEHLDSDQDGLLDHWETSGIDLDGTGTIDLNLAAMGADPFKRDLFMQIDWTADRPSAATPAYRHRPVAGVIRKLANFYASAPALPNGIQAGITLHVDAGAVERDITGQFYTRNMGLGPAIGGQLYAGPPVDVLYFGTPNSVMLPNVNAVSFDTVKSALFWSHHRGAREFAFLHVVFSDFHHAVGHAGDDNVSPAIGSVTQATRFGFQTASASASATWLRNNSVVITSGTGTGQIRRITQQATDGATGDTVASISSAWTTIPDASSTFVVTDASTGEGNAAERYDGAFAPGRNLAITLGDAGVGPRGETGAFTTQFQSLDHETGHLLTLMHGGVDHDNFKPNYVSVMNYAYQFCPAGQTGTDSAGNPMPGAAACPIDGYSGAADAVSNNWNNVNSRFALQAQSLGQAFGAIEPSESPFPAPREMPLRDITDRYGPLDETAPVTTIGSPLGGATFAAGNTIPFSFTATDAVGVVRGEVLFDVNGDATIADNEIFVPTFTPPNSFSFTVPALSGPSGSRKLSAVAYDAAGNPGVATITVNVGSVANVVVPNVVDMPRASAETALNAANLGLGTVSLQTSPTIAAGNVVSQNPAAAQSRAPGTVVALAISLGTNGVAVPDVAGMSQAAASSVLTGAGLAVGTVKNVQLVAPPGVVSQWPSAATIVAQGTQVDLLISTVVPTVPDVVGITQPAAASAITGAGLVVGTVTQQTSATVPSGYVISQSPPAGTSVAAGSAVDIVVSSGPVIVPAARLLTPDGTSLAQAFSTYPDARWFALLVEPGKTYVIETSDVVGDATANAIGTLAVFAPDGVSAPAEANVDCSATAGPRPPAVDVNADGVRCVLRTALPMPGMQQNKRPVLIKVARMDPSSGGGSQFRIRVREATIYGRWLTAGYDYHVEVENTTADAMCVEIARYPASGLSYTAGPGWSGTIASFMLTVPAFGAAKQVVASGNFVGADGEGSLRIGACASPTNFVAAGLHVSTYGFDTVGNRYLYFFTATANEGKTRSSW